MKFTFTEENKPLFFDFATECLQDITHTFVRRLGLIILLKMSSFGRIHGRYSAGGGQP